MHNAVENGVTLVSTFNSCQHGQYCPPHIPPPHYCGEKSQASYYFIHKYSMYTLMSLEYSVMSKMETFIFEDPSGGKILSI